MYRGVACGARRGVACGARRGVACGARRSGFDPSNIQIFFFSQTSGDGKKNGSRIDGLHFLAFPSKIK